MMFLTRPLEALTDPAALRLLFADTGHFQLLCPFDWDQYYIATFGNGYSLKL